MSKANEKRAAYLLSLCVPEKSVLLLDAEARIVTALADAERRAYRRMARRVRRYEQQAEGMAMVDGGSSYWRHRADTYTDIVREARRLAREIK